VRSAASGSILVARRAGTYAASIATTTRRIAAPANTGSARPRAQDATRRSEQQRLGQQLHDEIK
jgi:hypothetical protein